MDEVEVGAGEVVPWFGEASLPFSTTLSQAEIGFVTGCALGMDPCWVTKEGFQEVGRRMGKDLGRWRWRET